MTQSIHVMLVEDNPADADLTRELLASGKLQMTFTLAHDGVHACELLRAGGVHGSPLLPDLILLDLNLPRMSGREVLAELKKDSLLKRIPVVMLTSSDAERDVAESYDLGANCYVTKPLDLNGFHAVIHAVENFWFSIVRLPPKS